MSKGPTTSQGLLNSSQFLIESFAEDCLVFPNSCSSECIGLFLTIYLLVIWGVGIEMGRAYMVWKITFVHHELGDGLADCFVVMTYV